jgi:hypothetical protein
MSEFVDLGVSVFDADFTLNPYAYLQDLYDRKDVLGFHSDGMNFLFRFDQGRAVIFNKHCVRAMGNNEQLARLEADYAQRYPNRAWHFHHSYTHGEPDLKFKAAIGRFVADVASQASFADFYDEALIADCDAGLARIRRYMEDQFGAIHPESPLNPLIEAGRSIGMSDEQLIANIGGMFLTSISNTVGISSAFILRSLLRDPGSLATLREQPDLVRPHLAGNEHVIMELLRRDNHVKALTRQFEEPMELDGFTIGKGEVVCLYFPGINMDPVHWRDPLALDFSRRFTGENNIIFGGSFYTCIGRRLTMAFLGNIVEGFTRHLPECARVVEEELEVDGSWMAERIITRLPLELG